MGRCSRARTLLGVLPILFAGALVSPLSPAASANTISEENAKAGDSRWEAYANRAPAAAIEGYASAVSVEPGETLSLFVNSPGSSFHVEVSRLGWYGGLGGRRLLCLPSCDGSYPAVAQAGEPEVDALSGKAEANWSANASLEVPPAWTTGYYVAVFVLDSGPHAGKSAWYPFIVTDPGSTSEIVAQVPTNTWQAYNPWPGDPVGRSLFDFNSADELPAAKVSFERPFARRPPNRNYFQDPVFGSEIQAVRFLEREGYDVAYASDLDVDRDPGLLLDHGTDVALGHGSFWTTAIRDGWDRAQAGGRNQVFLGADLGAWVARYEDDGRTLVSYRYKPDPLTPPTTMFRRLDPARPECELQGVQRQGEVTYPDLWDYTVQPSAEANPWVQAAGLKAGDTIKAAVGYDTGAIEPECATPVMEPLFHYSGAAADEGADAVAFKGAQGGFVFSSGSTMFSHLLDSYGAVRESGQAVDPRIQAFVNAMLDQLTGTTRTERFAAAATSGRRLKLGRVRRNPANGTARLIAFVSGPGTVRLRGGGVLPRRVNVGTGAARPDGWTRLRLSVIPRQPSRGTLESRGTVRVAIRVGYWPSDGDAERRSRRIRLALRPTS